MTTIVWDGSVLAADSREALSDGFFHDKCNKIFKIGSSYIATAGDSSDGLLFVQWCKDRTKPKPTIGKHFEAVEIMRDGAIYLYDKNCIGIKWTGKHFALGSGGNFALGAVLAGVSAKEAVEIAKKLDINSGGKVKAVKIK